MPFWQWTINIEDFFHHEFMTINNFCHAQNYYNWKDINKWHLSGIHFLNWFYLFSLNRLSLICFFNWKKKKKLVWKIRVNPTRLTYNPIDPFKKTHFDPWPDWPANSINPTQPNPPVLPRLDFCGFAGIDVQAWGILWVCWNWW